MAAVPKIWDILKKGVEEGLGAKPAPVQGLMKLGYAWRSWLLSKGMDSVVFKALFGKVKPILGGRQKLFVSGGGPIASEVPPLHRPLRLFRPVRPSSTVCNG